MATILIVDDTPTNLGVVVEYLEAHGFRVLVAQDGEEDLRLLLAVAGQLPEPPVDLLTRGHIPPDRAGVAAVLGDKVSAQRLDALRHRRGEAVDGGPFREGRGVLVTVHEQGSSFIGEQDSLTTKCPSKYQAASASY